MIDSEHLSLESLRRIEQVCADFERDYLAHADIAAHLTGFSGVERAALIYELVGVDLELRAKAGLPLEASRYSEFDDPADREAGEQAYRRFSRSDTNSIAPSTLSGSQDSLGGVQTLASRIGPYQILHKIGEGGMGSVYLAEQTEPVKRRVALKVISVHKPSREILARFDAERQALALMDHHHIAKVLDAGVTPQGQPYFAMEFVDGEPLTRYCDKHQLSLPLRLALFIQTCRAVQHAHQKGVIHRDLKPANVLVTLHDDQPVAKVIDFGLAKALQNDGRLTDHSLLTRHGQLFGTLAYMSPEQAATNVLDVDARTDVYSLGAILYELLTGTTPLQPDRIRQEPLDRILAMIREEEPPRPSSRLKELGTDSSIRKQDSGLDPKGLARVLERDLDWIALKALEKDRSRRYETPSALADDVQRYLDHDVVLARPPSGGYRLRKAIRKHRLLFGSGLAIVSLLILGLIGTGGMWLRASIAEAASRQEGERARQQAINAIAARAEMKNQRDQAVESERKAVSRKGRRSSRKGRRWRRSRGRTTSWPLPAGTLVEPRRRTNSWTAFRPTCGDSSGAWRSDSFKAMESRFTDTVGRPTPPRTAPMDHAFSRRATTGSSELGTPLPAKNCWRSMDTRVRLTAPRASRFSWSSQTASSESWTPRRDANNLGSSAETAKLFVSPSVPTAIRSRR